MWQRSLVAEVVLFASALLAQSVNQQPMPKDASPASYDDTVEYIQERLGGQLEERGHCRFTYVDRSSRMFDAADLSPHVFWSDKSNSADVSCLRGRKCVGTYTSWRFQPFEGVDRKKLENAILHLLELCGVPPAKPDPF